MPHLHGKFTAPGVFFVCQPDGPDSAALLFASGAWICVVGAMWRTHLKIIPEVGISALAVRGGQARPAAD